MRAERTAVTAVTPPQSSRTMVRSLGPEQLAELRQAFNLFDTDSGGNINSKELGYAMRSLGERERDKVEKLYHFYQKCSFYDPIFILYMFFLLCLPP